MSQAICNDMLNLVESRIWTYTEKHNTRGRLREWSRDNVDQKLTASAFSDLSVYFLI